MIPRDNFQNIKALRKTEFFLRKLSREFTNICAAWATKTWKQTGIYRNFDNWVPQHVLNFDALLFSCYQAEDNDAIIVQFGLYRSPNYDKRLLYRFYFNFNDFKYFNFMEDIIVEKFLTSLYLFLRETNFFHRDRANSEEIVMKMKQEMTRFARKQNWQNCFV